MTKYFSNGCECENSTPMFQLSNYDDKGKLVQFNQFVVDQYEYTSKKGEKKSDTQTVRK